MRKYTEIASFFCSINLVTCYKLGWLHLTWKESYLHTLSLCRLLPVCGCKWRVFILCCVVSWYWICFIRSCSSFWCLRPPCWVYFIQLPLKASSAVLPGHGVHWHTLDRQHSRTQVAVQQDTSNLNPHPDAHNRVELLKYGLQYKLKLLKSRKESKFFMQRDKAQRLCSVKSRPNLMIKAAATCLYSRLFYRTALYR